MLLGNPSVILLRNLSSGKGLIQAGDGVVKVEDGIKTRKQERIFNSALSFD